MHAATLCGMDSALLSALAVLAGSALGSLTSIATSWLSQHVQFRARLHSDDLRRREQLYKTFIDEASRTYADALEHNEVKVSNLINLYALVSRMRILSSPQIVESADRVVHVIVDTYLAPNRTLRDVRESLGDHAMDVLLQFSNACRDELQMGWPGGHPSHQDAGPSFVDLGRSANTGRGRARGS